MARSPQGLRPPAEPTESEPASGEDRFEQMLDERFASKYRRVFARDIEAHDRNRTHAGFDPTPFEKSLIFTGRVPARVRQLLEQWLPALVGFAEARGLGLRGLVPEARIYHRQAYEAAHGAVPSAVKLPASSYQFTALYHHYAVSVVLPEQVGTLEEMLTVVRAWLTRLFGDVFLRDQIYSLEGYREDVAGQEKELTVGLGEKITLLGRIPHTSPELEKALEAHARTIGVNYKRQPDQVRKEFLRHLAAELEEQRLSPERVALVDGVMARYLAEVQDNLQTSIAQAIAAVDELNRQMVFLHPEQQWHYERLRRQNPLHFLRAAKLRLEFLLELLRTLLQDYGELTDPALPLSPAVEERIEGQMQQLESQGLARPYLVPGVRLSAELERKRVAFPLEVHTLIHLDPNLRDAPKAFRQLSKKLENSVYQRIYTALLLTRHWVRLRERGQGAEFERSDKAAALKSSVANFRYRKPMLEALSAQIEVVLELGELNLTEAGGAVAGKTVAHKARFPITAFTQAWGQFAAHALAAEFFSQARPLKGFEAERYWIAVETQVRQQMQGKSATANLVYLLKSIYDGVAREAVSQEAVVEEAAGAGLLVLLELLRQSAPSFRFAISHAARLARETVPPDAVLSDELPRQLEQLAASVLHARAARLRNAIVLPPGVPEHTFQ